ncbi:unnamed protein product, partial [Vitis vinifera]
MEKELLELFEATKKAADAAAVNSGAPSEEERCLDALKQLKDFPVTYQVLVSTQVGKRLRTLTKHPTKKIQALASDLIDIWKNIVIEETTKNKKNGDLEDKESPKPVTANPENVKATPLLKPSHNIVGPPKLTSISKCNDALRDKVRELLSEALSKVVGEADEDIMDAVNACDPIRVAVSVESVMFEKWDTPEAPPFLSLGTCLSTSPFPSTLNPSHSPTPSGILSLNPDSHTGLLNPVAAGMTATFSLQRPRGLLDSDEMEQRRVWVCICVMIEASCVLSFDTERLPCSQTFTCGLGWVWVE